jgi:hypothetical protein
MVRLSLNSLEIKILHVLVAEPGLAGVCTQ